MRLLYPTSSIYVYRDNDSMNDTINFLINFDKFGSIKKLKKPLSVFFSMGRNKAAVEKMDAFTNWFKIKHNSKLR